MTTCYWSWINGDLHGSVWLFMVKDKASHPSWFPGCYMYFLSSMPFPFPRHLFLLPSTFILIHLVQQTVLVCSAGRESVSNVPFKCQRSWIAYNPMVKHTLFATIKWKHFEVKNKALASTITSARSTTSFHQWLQCNAHKESKTWPSKAFIFFHKNRYERFFFFLHLLQELGCCTSCFSHDIYCCTKAMIAV